MHLSNALRRLGRLLLLLCCAWLLTGPQLLLQLGAWSWMIASYAQQSTIEQAVAETFSGARPCQLCQLITSAEAAQEHSPANAPDEVKSLKLLPGQSQRLALAPRNGITAKRSPIDQLAAQRATEVPTPPPRRVHVSAAA